MVNPYAQRYTQVQTETTSPGQVLLLLYEGAVRFLGQAREHLEARRIGPGKTALSKAMAIVAELQNTLDPQAGWEGAEGLHHLYGHMLLELTEANLKGELNRIDAVRGLMTGLYDAWREAIESQPAAPSAADAAPGGTAQGERPPFRASV
jgi:flagellar protein FliS